MISNFSSFVEFFAAIYVTMAVNNDFCSNFWTPRYYQDMELLLKTYLFSSMILHNWRRVILSVGLYFMVYFILKIGNWECISNSSLSIMLFRYKSILLIGIVILPVVNQIFVYWLHSSIYKGYLKHHVHIEHDRFKKSMDGIKNRDKSKVDKIYMDAWTDAVFVSNEDPTLTSFYKVLNQQLLRIASPSYSQLLYSWILYHFKGLSRKRKSDEEVLIVADIDKNEMIRQNMSVQTECTHSVALDFTKEFREYCDWKKTAGKNGKLKNFCMNNGISYKDMRAWIIVNKPDKQ